MDKIWKVSEINSAVRELLENSLGSFWLQGEIGTLNIHSSGHVYMTLKDSHAQLRVVFFGGAAQARKLGLQVGSQIESFGRLTVYEVRGEYQFSARMIRPLGVGELQRRFEELKNKLQAEGLFEPASKKSIPQLPRQIGVVTSPDGAALRDFLQVVERRFPDVNIRIYPAPVQGDGAEYVIARGIEFFNKFASADVIVVTRGGGSMEDLQPFNTEVLARSIAASNIPVISAVGHEIDFTISDFVADLRVPTPSAAAELAVGQRLEMSAAVNNLYRRLDAAVRLRAEQQQRRMQTILGSYILRDPLRMLERPKQQLDELLRDATDTVTAKLIEDRMCLQEIHTRLAQVRPQNTLARNAIMLKNLHRRLNVSADRAREQHHAAVKGLDDRLRSLDPEAVVGRGYAVLRDATTGGVISSTGAVASGQKVKARVSDGTIDLTVTTGMPEKKENYAKH
jgi:exodeoxyribonuclease VII large subunit